jgi:MFS family permease
VSQPIYASVSEVVGRRSPLHVSILLFGVGSVVFATANDMNIVVVGRLIKGLGAGGLDVIQTIILCDITTLKERPRYLGLMSLATATGGVTGPILGGAFAELVDWRWLGWINVLVVGITGVLAFFFLHLRPIDAESKTKLLRLDWIGFLLFTIAATAVVLPLSWAGALFAWSS